jgi:hypothetical protein
MDVKKKKNLLNMMKWNKVLPKIRVNNLFLRLPPYYQNDWNLNLLSPFQSFGNPISYKSIPSHTLLCMWIM